MQGFFVTGTDTDVGKTVVSAWLLLRLEAAGLEASYWKPVQAGSEPETDTETVRRLTLLPPGRVVKEAYVLPEPLAPHEAARRAGIAIDMDKIAPPDDGRVLVAEGAGGMLVPLTEDHYVIDLADRFDLPLVLVARSTLGTINHTLLSLEALRRRTLRIAGIVLNGPRTPHNRDAIERYGDIKVIAEIPLIEPLTRSNLLDIEPELDVVELAKGRI